MPAHVPAPDVTVTLVIEVDGRCERFAASAETSPRRGSYAQTARRLIDVTAVEADEWLVAVDQGMIAPAPSDQPLRDRTDVLPCRTAAHAADDAKTVVLSALAG